MLTDEAPRPQATLQLPAGPPKSTIREYILGRDDSRMSKLDAERSTLPTSNRHRHETIVEDLDPAQSVRTSMRATDGSVADLSSVPGLTNTISSGAPQSVPTDMDDRQLERSQRIFDHLDGPLPPQDIILECPFPFLDCHQEFNGYHEREWIDHSLTHLKTQDRRGRRLKVDPPTHNRCTFCEVEFRAPNGGLCWQACMSHVKLHHERGARLAHARPNFTLIEYLWQKGLLSPSTYRKLKPTQALPTPPSSDDGDKIVTCLNEKRHNVR